MDLLSIAEKLTSRDHFSVNFSESSCLHSLNKLASCEACYTLCPTSAIQPGKPPSFDSQSCVVCRACVQACPVGAYTGEDKVKGLLSSAARAVEKHRVTHFDLLCDQHTSPALGPQDSALGLRIEGCLAQLGSGAYLALFLLGVEKVIVRLDDCPNCAWGALKERILLQVEQARALAGPWLHADKLAILDQVEGVELEARPGWNTASPPLSRAELLHPAPLQAESRYSALISPDALAVSQHHLSLDRYRQVIASKHLLADNQSDQSASAAFVSFVRAEVTEACTGCNICSQSCPTEALKRTVIEEKEFKLSFSPLKCVDCKVCVALCPESAITLESPVPVSYLLEGELVLYQGSLVKCQRCGTLFSPKTGGKLCPTCQFRRDHPFGSRTPPHRTM